MKNRYKKIAIGIVFALCLFRSADVFTQTIGLNYQAVISDPKVYQVPGKDIVLNHLVLTEIDMRFSIIDGSGLVEYTEEHFTTTNKFGEVNLIIGRGQASLANFADIVWDGGQKQLFVEIDYKRGLGFQHSNTQHLLYLPHPINHSDGSAIASNTDVINAIKQAAGLNAEGNYSANSSAYYISAASSLAEAHNRLDAAVKTNAQAIANFTDDQNISGSGLSGTILTVGIEDAASQTVDLASLKDGIGTDNQKGTEVYLEEPLDIDSDGNNEMTVEDAITKLKTELVMVSAASSDSQTLSLNDETHHLTLQNGGTVDLSPYFNEDNQTGSEVTLVGEFDADGDGTPEENVEQVITALIDILFGCTLPTACNYKPSPIFVNDNLCEDPEDGKNCSGQTITVGVPYQGGVVFYVDQVNTKFYVVAKEDFGTQAAWGCNETTINGADGTVIGTGKQNTQDIMADCTAGSIAASLCDSYGNEGFDDWYLPSSGELLRIYQNLIDLNAANGFVGFESGAYWSSTQSSLTSARVVDMGSGIESDSQKSSSERIRAVRSFDY
jgi:hypothetical protein